MTHFEPVIECKNCLESIHLPYPNPLETESNLPSWPRRTWRTAFVCNVCGHVSNYYVEDVHWKPFQTPAPYQPHTSKAVFFCEFDCGHNCIVGARVHIIADADTAIEGIEEEVRKKVSEARFHPSCLKGLITDVTKARVRHIHQTTLIV